MSCELFHLSCRGFIAGPKIKNMGFLSGRDDLKKINAMLRGKAERQALPCLHSPGGATNLRKLKKKIKKRATIALRAIVARYQGVQSSI